MAGVSRADKTRLYSTLRDGILLGRLHSGERLIEERLAEQFHLSRTPVREVLSRLESEGLVEQTPFRGARVRLFGADEIRGIYDLRALLEGHAARQAALQLEPDELSALDRCNRELAEAAERFTADTGDVASLDLPRVVNANQRFHGMVHAASGNPYLVSTLHGLSQLPLVYRAMQFYGRHGVSVTIQQHCELLEALKQRDSDWSEAIMRVHIYHGRDALLHHLDELEGRENTDGEGIGHLDDPSLPHRRTG